MIALPQGYNVTPEEYLQLEQDADTRNEYHNGVLVSMSGASPEHNLITVNLIVEIAPALRKSGCETFANDMRVKIEASNCYYYPDVVVVCGEPVYEQNKDAKSLTNPIVVVEALSPSTWRADRGTKMVDYQTLDTLTAYLIVHQDRPRVEIYTRNAADRDSWAYEIVAGIDSEISLLGINIALASIYRGIQFSVGNP